jgi:sortase family protein
VTSTTPASGRHDPRVPTRGSWVARAGSRPAEGARRTAARGSRRPLRRLWIASRGLWIIARLLWTSTQGLWTTTQGLWIAVRGLWTTSLRLWTTLGGLWTERRTTSGRRGSLPHRGTWHRQVALPVARSRLWGMWPGVAARVAATGVAGPGVEETLVAATPVAATVAPATVAPATAMLHRPTSTRRVGGLGAVLVGCLMVAGCQGAGGEPAAEVRSTRGVGEAVGVGSPVSIAIPAVGVDARVVPVGLRADRAMEVPAVDLVGWYELGPRPGEAGPAVVVGHVDSRSGPAVFSRLGELRRGDRIVIGQQGGAARSFRVERVERHPKTALPVERIWDRARQPVLRLITCGGSFDRSTGHYRDNIVVYARATT